jgi:hypothetical protein
VLEFYEFVGVRERGRNRHDEEREHMGRKGKAGNGEEEKSAHSLNK